MTPIADIQVPAWGSRVPVLAIDGDTWTVQGPETRAYPSGRRKLKADAINLLSLCPTRVALIATHAGETRGSPPIPEDAVGEDWYEARQKRRAQLLWCSGNGWSVRSV